MPKRLVYKTYGNPLEVIELENYELPQLGEEEVCIGLQYANINPSDMGMIGGSYGKLKELPATAGREGIGIVVQTGAKVTRFNKGDLVKIPETQGAWQSHILAKESELLKLPADLDPQQAATLFINPTTAYMLLETFVSLKPGDFIIQNAANSQVGLWVIQLAKARGIKTINIVRRDGLEKELTSLGADHVIVDNADYPKTLKNLTGGAKPRLALNSVGGESVINMIKTLEDGGVCVTFGGMVGDLVRFPTRFFIFNDVQLRGFWMDKWIRTHSQEAIESLYQKVFDCVTLHGIQTPIEAVYSLEDFHEAIQAFQKPRMGKILLRP